MEEIEKKARLLFHKWKTELRNKDRSRPSVSNNFDEIVSAWFRLEVPFDVAFELIKDAIKEHQPSDGCVRATYKRLKSVAKKTEREFKEDWNGNIEATAYQSFYSYYEIEIPPEPVKNFGSMSEKEYKLQRRYAETYPDIDIDDIKHEPIEDLSINLEEL